MLKLGLDSWDFVVIVTGATLMIVVDFLQERGLDIEKAVLMWKLGYKWSVYGVLIISIILFGAYGFDYAPVDFIYAQF